MEEVPAGWATASLGDEIALDIQTGFACGAHSRDDSGVPHLRPMNVSEEGRIVLENVKYVRRSEVDRDERWLRAGDVLFNNTNSPELVGKTALYALPEPRAYSNHMTRVRCHHEVIEPSYCALFLHSLWQRGYFEEHCNNHVSQASISRGVLGQVRVPLPPLAEQKRIVEKVEALLDQVQAARDRLERVQQILKRFRQAVLAAACAGRLTEDWRQAKRDRLSSQELGRGIGAKSPGADDLPDTDLPESWSWATTESLCDASRPITYGVIKLGLPVTGGIPTLRSSDVRHLRIESKAVKSIARSIANQYSRTFLRGGEVVVTVRGTLGGVAVVPADMAGFNISREVALLPFKQPLNPHFFASAIASTQVNNWLLERSKGVAYTGINISDLRRLPLPLPPLEEQAEIVSRVKAIFSLAESVEGRVESGRLGVDGAPQAILSKAFAAELVPTEAEMARTEGRGYESGEELLRRVRRERTTPIAERGFGVATGGRRRRR